MYSEVKTMLLFKHGKRILFSLLIASTLSSDAFAETIVRTERTYNHAAVAKNDDSDHKKVNSGQDDSPDKSLTQNTSDNTTVAVGSDTATKRDSEDTSPKADADTRRTSSTENTPNADIVLDGKKANSSKQKNLRYIEGFKIKGPVIETLSQGGFFMYASKLYEENEQYGNFTILMQKSRNAAILGPSDISTYIICVWSIEDFDALISKNHKPRFIVIANDGTVKIIELTMYNYSSEHFTVKSPQWGNLLQNAHKLYLEVSSQSGDNVRLPIPADAIEQWISVMNADMKKLKKEFENK